MNESVVLSYRGDAVGQVVLAGDAEQFVLRQLSATEGTGGRLLLQFRGVGTSEVRTDVQGEDTCRNGREVRTEQEGEFDRTQEV